MSKSKKEKSKNPIEDAIGKRTETPPQEKLTDPELQTIAQDVKKAILKKNEMIPHSGAVPTPKEMVDLESLQQETMERLQDNYQDEPELEPVVYLTEKKMEQTTPVLKPESQNVTKTSSQESLPPQSLRNDLEKEKLEMSPEEYRKQYIGTPPPEGKYPKFKSGVVEDKRTFQDVMKDYKKNRKVLHKDAEFPPPQGSLDNYKLGVEKLADYLEENYPAEDPQLTALKKHIMNPREFNVNTVAMHLNILCTQPMVIPSTTTWDMPKRERIPEMVYRVLTAPGFLDTIFPALKIVMGSNIGNIQTWTSGISISFAFFGIIQTLPYVLAAEGEN